VLLNSAQPSTAIYIQKKIPTGVGLEALLDLVESSIIYVCADYNVCVVNSEVLNVTLAGMQTPLQDEVMATTAIMQEAREQLPVKQGKQAIQQLQSQIVYLLYMPRCYKN